MKLGIPEDATAALVSLGAGEINDIENMRKYVIDGLVERGVYVIVADSMLKPMMKSFDNELVRVVQTFPIMRSRNCFDFAVIAGGYNSVHECILLRLPTHRLTQVSKRPCKIKTTHAINTRLLEHINVRLFFKALSPYLQIQIVSNLNH